MNIEQLQYICMVAKTNSITVAAENLYVTQQTISKAINKLETELGVVLMIRSHKGVQLTDIGKVFVQKASQIVHDFQELHDSTAVNHCRNLSGKVRLYQSSYVGHVLGSKFLTSMRRQYPKLHVMVEESLTADMLERLMRGEKEIALVQAVNYNFGIGAMKEYKECLDWDIFFRDILVACVAENSPLAKRESVSLKELSKYPVAWGECLHMRDILQQEYDIDIHVLLDSTNVIMQREAVIDGAAFSFATELIVHGGSYDTSGLKVLPIKESLRLETYLIKPKGYVPDRLQKIVIEELKQTLRKL